MRTRTFRAASMQDALEKVRRGLGEDAVILQSRERRRRLLGIGPERESVEIVASSSISAPRWRTSSLRVDPAQKPADPKSDFAPKSIRPDRADSDFSELPAELAELFARLLAIDMPEPFVRRIIIQLADTLDPEDLNDPGAVHSALDDLLAASLPVAPPIVVLPGKRRVVAFVGPTGVGKTTTIGKLAAILKSQSGLKIGLVTLDPAPTPLVPLAAQLGLALSVAVDLSSIGTCLRRLADVDLVMIDTPGRSPRDEEGLHHLHTMLASARPDETHLVASAAAGCKAMQSVAQRFARLRPDRIIVTKLDEAETLGPTLAALATLDLPLSYMTTGQVVPDDIEPGQSERLVDRALGRAR